MSKTKFKCVPILFVIFIVNTIADQEWKVEKNEAVGTFMVKQPGFNGEPIVKANFNFAGREQRIPLSTLTEQIQIDGNPGDEAWLHATSIHDFIGKNSDKSVEDQTTVKVLYDQKKIYLQMICMESMIDKIISQCEIPDSPVMLDDHVGIYITPLKAEDEKHFYEGYYYYIAVNPSGTIFDAFYNPWHGGMFYPNWNPDSALKTERLSDKWIIEMSIAFEGLEYYLPAGRAYLLNFTRKQFGHGHEKESFAKDGLVVRSTYESMVPWRIPFYENRFIPLSEYWPDSLEFVRPEIKIKKMIKWPETPSIKNLVMHDTGELPSQKTEVTITYDDDSLYVRYLCYESLMDELTAKYKDHDWPKWDEWGTYRSPEKYKVEDDAVGMYISPDFDEKDQYHTPYYLIMVNTDGVVYDACFDQFGIFYKTWESNLKSKIVKETDRWKVELSIPFSSFEIDPEKSDDWGFNAFRRRPPKSNTGAVRVKSWRKGYRKDEMDVLYQGGYEITCWSPTFGHLRNPCRMGVVKGLEFDSISQIRAYVAANLPELERQVNSLEESGKYGSKVTELERNISFLKKQITKLSSTNLEQYYKIFRETRLHAKTWTDWIYSERIKQVSQTDRRLTDVHFIDQKNGWTVGAAGVILHTSDGGTTWEIQNSGTDYDLEGVYFTDNLNGWVVGGQIRPPREENFIDRDVGAMGIILHTKDGGKTWLPQLMGDARWFYDVTFADKNIGWAVGSYGLVMKTTDGGATWHIQPSGSLKWLYEVCFVDRNYGWISCEDEKVLITQNGGESWKTLSTPLYQNTNDWPGKVFAINFIDKNTGWCVGDGGNLFKSIDGGNNWHVLNLPLENDLKELMELRDVQFIDKNIGWAVSCSGDALFCTTDGGTTWMLEHTGSFNWMNKLYFVNSNIGWMVGERGTILNTTDGGVTWQQQRSDGNQLDILMIHAHSDDELSTAHITTNFADQGYKVGYVRYERDDHSTYRLGELRTQEFRATSAFLGGVVNRTMDHLGINGGREGFPAPYYYQTWKGWEPSERWIVSIIRALRPRVIITQELAYDKASHSVGAYMVTNAVKAAADPNKYSQLGKIGLSAWKTPKTYIRTSRRRRNSYNPWPPTLDMSLINETKSPRLGYRYDEVGGRAFILCQSQGGYVGYKPGRRTPAALHLWWSTAPVVENEQSVFDGLMEE